MTAMTRPNAFACFVAGTAFFLLSEPALAATWTDRGEYDLALAIHAEPTAEKRLALLDQWKQKYPKSEMRQARRELYLDIYLAGGAWQRVLELAREIAAEDPGNMVGAYWLALLVPGAKDTPPDLLDAGEKASRQLLAGLPSYFDPKRRPASTPSDAWQKQKSEFELLAHRTLAWIQWRRGAAEAAEQELAVCLKINPANAEASAWLGAAMALHKEPEGHVPALWHLARAASLEGDGALPESQRREVSATLERAYNSYHGDAGGLEQLRKDALASPNPPDGFKVESAADAAARRQEEELNRTNPQLAAWLRIRKQLEAPDGEKYMAETLSAVPLPRLRGVLIRCSPADQPTELVLGIRDAASEEVILKLGAPLYGPAEAGIALEFQGTAVSFTREPFALIINASAGDIAGWPERKAKPAAPAKPSSRKAAKKK